MKTLRGITWDHPRGFNPMPASAARFTAEINPEVRIEWQRRTLHEFGAAPVDELAKRFDLVVLDHPWAGFIAETECYLPLDSLLPKATQDALATHSAGPSHATYSWNGHQWALAIDAATPSASYRPDLLADLGFSVPTRWDEVLEIGRAAQGVGKHLAIPLGPVDAITVFLSLADNICGEPFAGERQVVSREVGHRVMNSMRAIAELCAPATFELTPVSMMDRMSSTDEIVYCPMAYSYNNYSRDGFRPQVCLYADIPSLANDGPRGSHIGGTGLAISAQCKHPAEAAQYASYVASSACQRGEYFSSGGQPAHSDAWDDPQINRECHDFFRNTRQTIERAYVRPRYNGYIGFQYEAGRLIQLCLRESGDVDALMKDLDALYQQSLAGGV
jgi:multiple sugar transport system substrate-binding protein